MHQPIKFTFYGIIATYTYAYGIVNVKSQVFSCEIWNLTTRLGWVDQNDEHCEFDMLSAELSLFRHRST
jgi:hypothetical protein